MLSGWKKRWVECESERWNSTSKHFILYGSNQEVRFYTTDTAL